MKITLVLLTLNVCLVNCKFLSYGKCFQDPDDYSSPHLRHPDSYTTEYEVLEDCQDGTISWNYPKGSIILHFRVKSCHKISIKNAGGCSSMKIMDVTHGKELKFVRNENEEYWLKGENGKLDIKMSGIPNLQTFMAALAYNITSSKPEPTTTTPIPITNMSSFLESLKAFFARFSHFGGR